MAGKLTTIMTRKEAEVYCAHGLHREALNLYQKLLATSPNIDKTLKKTIEDQIVTVKAHLASDHPDEHARISAKDILRLKEGWGGEATAEELMVCAQAFFRIGHYRSALTEMARLIEKGVSIKEMPGLFADGLRKICPPQRVLATLNRLAPQKIFPKPGAYLNFLLLITEEMVKLKAQAHALALYGHLRTNTLVKTKAHHRLTAIANDIEALDPSRRTQ